MITLLGMKQLREDWRKYKATLAPHIKERKTFLMADIAYIALQDAMDILEAIDELRKEEGAAVTILCDNPDFNGLPNNAIEVSAEWTISPSILLQERFTGNTLIEALNNAVKAKKERTDESKH